MVLVVVLIILATFIGLNALADWLISLVLGGALSKIIILSLYYYLIRLAITYVAFPGSFKISQRQFEFQFA